MSGKRRGIGFSFAWYGIKEVIKTELNFKIHLGAMLLVIILGLIFHLRIVEWLFLIIAIGLVLMTEMINTVIERLIDYLNPTIHPEAKVIKDMAAGAVLIASIFAALIGFLIFGSKLILLLQP